MLKTIGIIAAAAIGLAIFAFVWLIIGLQNAPRPLPRTEREHIQVLCDSSRKEPWKQDIAISCEYMQDFFAIDYICEEIRGCYTEIRNGQNSY